MERLQEEGLPREALERFYNAMEGVDTVDEIPRVLMRAAEVLMGNMSELDGYGLEEAIEKAFGELQRKFPDIDVESYESPMREIVGTLMESLQESGIPKDVMEMIFERVKNVRRVKDLRYTIYRMFEDYEKSSPIFLVIEEMAKFFGPEAEGGSV
jgi:hypothetical protein